MDDDNRHASSPARDVPLDALFAVEDDPRLNLVAEAIRLHMIDDIAPVLRDAERMVTLAGIRFWDSLALGFSSRGLGDEFAKWRAGAMSETDLLSALRGLPRREFLAPPTLYKYRSISTAPQRTFAADLIQKGAIYLPSPLDLNDPLDCAPRVELADGTTWPSTDEDLQMVYRSLIRMHVGVFCTSATAISAAMWAYYADDHRGIAVEIDGPALQLFVSDCGLGLRLRKVTYPDRLAPVVYSKIPDSVRLDESVESLFQKRQPWAHESEWRLVREFFTATFPRETSMRLIYLPQFIRGVLLGLRASDETASWAALCCERAGLPPPRRILVDPTTGTLTIPGGDAHDLHQTG